MLVAILLIRLTHEGYFLRNGQAQIHVMDMMTVLGQNVAGMVNLLTIHIRRKQKLYVTGL